MGEGQSTRDTGACEYWFIHDDTVKANLRQRNIDMSLGINQWGVLYCAQSLLAPSKQAL